MLNALKRYCQLSSAYKSLKKSEDIPRSDLMAYSMGGFGSNLMFHLIGTYLMYFLTDFYGISPLVVGQIFLVARVIDAMSDPLFGVIADNTQTRFGRYRPYLIFGAPVVGFAIALVFSGPELSPMGKILFASAAYILYSLASTVVNIPYHSLTPVMSKSYHERTLVVACKQGVGALAALTAVTAPSWLLSFFSDNVNGAKAIGITLGCITTIMFWICAYGARRYDVGHVCQKKQKQMSFRDITSVIGKNSPLIALMVAHATNVFGFAIETSIAIYFFKYYLGQEAHFPLLKGVGSVLPLFLMIALPFLGGYFSKKTMFLTSSWVGMLTCLTGYLFIDWIPLEILFPLLVLSMVCNIFSGNLSWLLVPDCVEYGEYKTGINANGFTTSMMMYVAKCSSAVAGLAVGFFLSAVNYIPNQVQPDSVLQTILMLKFLVVVFAHMCSIFAMKYYSITPDRYEQIVAELEERKLVRDSAAMT